MRVSDFPDSNDTREVVAAYQRWVLQLGEPKVVVSKLSVNCPQKPLPEQTNAFSVVMLSGISIEQARDAQFIVGSASQTKAWGGPTTYRWATTCSEATFLVSRRPVDNDYILAFPLIYLPESDIKLILQQASDKSHLEHYARLGLATDRIQLFTFQFTELGKWERVNNVADGITA